MTRFDAATPQGELPFLRGGGEMGERMRAFDFSATDWGHPAGWPPSLRMAVSLCLNSSLPTAIYWGPALLLLYNDAWVPIAGEKHPWALGRSAEDVWPDIWHVIEPQLVGVLTTGEAFATMDQMLPMMRGGRLQQTHWDYSFSPILDGETGVALGVFNQGNETTARLNAERALRASEERLEYALGASNGIGTWDWDVPNDRVTADARFARLYGVDPAKAKAGAPLAEFFGGIHPDDRARAHAAVQQALRTGKAFSSEYRLLDDNGEARWVVAQGRCTLAPDGTPLRFPGVSFDITERKRSEEALQSSEARFQAIVNSIDQMIWSTRPDGYHDFYNQRWYDFTGAPEGTTDGAGWNDMFHPEDQERAWSAWNHCLQTGEPYHIEYRLRHRSGTYRWVLGRAQAVRDEAGQITRWFGTCTDIQEIVDAREVLARSRKELEREVGDRTAELMRAEEALHQAQKMEAIGQLTGGIAHDFNNMLAVILGALNLLERRLAKGETDIGRFIEAAKDGAARAATLTHRLLAFARRQPLRPEVVEANRMIEGMTELLTRTLGEQVSVRTVLGPDLWRTHADANQLESAIINLAVNARDAMAQGGNLTIETANAVLANDYSQDNAVLAGDYVMIAVSDTGEGMPPEVANKAFDPFFTTKPVGKGTGLGLSQVFGFVRQSGGHVKIYSEIGLGTSVKVYLPRYGGEAAPAIKQAQAQPDAGAKADELILVVEDDERVRAYSAEALRELGYTVLPVASGDEALDLLDQDHRPTLLFTDVVMPGMNGREVAKRARGKLPGLKVLYTTGYTPMAVEDSGALDPGERPLQKPFTIEQLAARVRAAIDG